MRFALVDGEKYFEVIATVLGESLGVDVLAAILNGLIFADENEELNEYQAAVAQKLFEHLCAARPDAAGVAANM